MRGSSTNASLNGVPTRMVKGVGMGMEGGRGKDPPLSGNESIADPDARSDRE
jgi:hypothetical protein